MASKVITISLPEALEWKLTQIGGRTGIPKSVLVSKALLLLFEDEEKITHPRWPFSNSLHHIQESYDRRNTECVETELDNMSDEERGKFLGEIDEEGKDVTTT